LFLTVRAQFIIFFVGCYDTSSQSFFLSETDNLGRAISPCCVPPVEDQPSFIPEGLLFEKQKPDTVDPESKEPEAPARVKLLALSRTFFLPGLAAAQDSETPANSAVAAF
jgi:hypothetical protein